MIDIIFSIPYSSELSKNKRFAFYNSKVKNKKHVQMQDLITHKFKSLLRYYPKPNKCKFFMHLVLHRPTRGTDASNYVNPVLDALKVCLPMDDNMCAGSWDFEEDKKNPRFEIRVMIPEHEML